MPDLISSDDADKIVPGSQVSLHFEIRLPDGAVVDSTFDKQPAVLRIGDGNLPPGFEQHLVGLRAGADREFQVEPEDAFGPRREENLRRLPKDRFTGRLDDGALEPGLMVSFDGPGGELPGVVQSLEGEQVVVDFNHPLAGYVILFRVEIIDVSQVGNTPISAA